MSYTRIRPTSTSVTTPHKTQAKTDDKGQVKCTTHQRVCKRQVAGKDSKNPGRAFYACPLPREDPNRCKFFQWEDQLQGPTLGLNPPSIKGGSASKAAQLAAKTNQTLGQSPQKRFGTTPDSAQYREISPIADEIDWERVDTDNLEREAIAFTPGSQKAAASQDGTLGRSQIVGGGGTGSVGFRERLREAVDEGLKRKRDDDEIVTPSKPKRLAATVDDDNPFLATTPGLASPANHSLLSPTLSTLSDLGEHLSRQDRLLRAADQMKQGLRKTVASLQEKNKALEERVKELEALVAKR